MTIEVNTELIIAYNGLLVVLITLVTYLIYRWRKEIETSANQLASANNTLQSAYDTYENRIRLNSESHQQEIQHKNSHIEQLLADAEQSRKIADEAREQLRNTLDEFAAERRKTEDIRAKERREWDHKLDEFTKLVTDLTQKVELLEKERNDAIANLTRAEKQAQTATSMLHDERDEHTLTKQTVAQLSRSNQEIYNKNSDLAESVKKLTDKLKVADATIQQLTQQNSRLQAEIEILRKNGDYHETQDAVPDAVTARTEPVDQPDVDSGTGESNPNV